MFFVKVSWVCITSREEPTLQIKKYLVQEKTKEVVSLEYYIECNLSDV
jgi:hypothetical protein